MLYPLKFKPVYKDYIWGGKNLKSLGKKIPEDRVTAESWEVSTHPDGRSIISNGFLSGKSLTDAIDAYPEEILGKPIFDKYQKRFPLLVKFIDAEKNLSVQVHPDDRYAMQNETGDTGKNEMWYILEAKKGAKLIYGMKEGITKENFMAAAAEKKIGDCLETVDVQKGDVLNIPAGLVHAIGEGIILAEIQQNSNTTYRLFDYNRKDANGRERPLHLEKAMDVIDFSINSKSLDKRGIKLSLGRNSSRTIHIANDYFIIEKYIVNGTVMEKQSINRFIVFIAIEGSGYIESENTKEHLKKGDSILIPAALESYSISGRIKLLKAYIPCLESDILKPLLKSGYNEKELYENIQGLDLSSIF